MILVLSPAKALDFTTPATIADHTQPEFLDQSQLLIKRLRTLSAPGIEKLMGVSKALAVLNASRYSAWAQPFTRENAKQAILAFNGDVYEGLDARTLTPADLIFAQDHVRILSGLYGVLRPLDLMQAYRLEMGTRLSSRRGKDLYAFWGNRIVDSLNSALRDAEATALVNLASAEYFRAVKLQRLAVPVIQPIFEDWSAGRFRVVSFFAKRARGLMARFAITGRLLQPQGLQAFTDEGYAYTAMASDESRWVFRRKPQ